MGTEMTNRGCPVSSDSTPLALSKLKVYFANLQRVNLDAMNASFVGTTIDLPPAIDNNGFFEFMQRGYLDIQSVIEPEAVRAANQACDILDDLASDSKFSFEDINLESPYDGWIAQDGTTESYQGQIRKIKNLMDHGEPFGNLALHPNILRIVRSLVGPHFRLHSKGFLMNKPARVSSEKKWHQDAAYFPNDTGEILTVWIPLCNVNESNGCLVVLPESHTVGIIEHVGPEAHIQNVDTTNAVSCPMDAGSLNVMGKYTVHYSGLNLTDKPRRALIFRYQELADALER